MLAAAPGRANWEGTPLRDPRVLTDQIKGDIAAAYARLREGMGLASRPTQRQMIAAVAQTLATAAGDDTAAVGPLLVEAPTGTGKSLAYLVAGVPVAQATQRRLVISTGTVALQQQLADKDLPRVLPSLGEGLHAAVVKGRSRYLCPVALDTALGSASQADLGFTDSPAPASTPDEPSTWDAEAVGQAVALRQAFESGKWGGDLDEWPQGLSAPVRTAVTSTSSTCLGTRCPQYSRCPLRTVREQAATADVIVANHALLLAELDLARAGSPNALLPDPAQMLLVVDEAHQLQEVARNHAASHLDTASLAPLAARLVPWGLAYAQANPERSGAQALADFRADLGAATQALTTSAGRFERLVAPLVEQASAHRFPLGQLPETLRVAADHLREDLRACFRLVRRGLRALQQQPGEAARSPLTQAGARLLEQLEAAGKLACDWSEAAEEGDALEGEVVARWIERHGQAVRACSSPASGGALLERTVWAAKMPVVLTSATLSEGGNFRRILAELHVRGPARTLALPSPFNLPEQAELRVPWIDACPSDPQAHTKAVIGWLKTELNWRDGATLVLFTSRRQMEEVHDKLPAKRRAQVLCQGALGKAELLSQHAGQVAAGQGSVIFGLASFAEGLDLPGQLCTEVIVVKLAFGVPDDPIEQTLAEVMAARGGNAFAERAVPLATRRLVQACGRLIRTETDRGRIVVLDRRLVTKAYGRRMLGALPPYRRQIDQPPAAQA